MVQLASKTFWDWKMFLVLKLLQEEVPQQQMLVNFEPIGGHANNA